MTNLEFGIELAMTEAIAYGVQSAKDAFHPCDMPCADHVYGFLRDCWFASEDARLETLLKFLPLDMPDRFGEEYDRLIDQ